MKYLIVGLGNIGKEYTNTRHNIGFSILDAYAKASNVLFTTKRYGQIAQLKYKSRQLLLLKPATYMNLSGKAVKFWLQNQNINICNLLIITDDLNLPFLKMRLKPKGGDGGHNGLNNIIELINNQNFARLRIGIGNNFSKGKQIDYVLNKWTDSELVEIEKNYEKSINIIKSFVSIGIERTMNSFN